MQKQKKRGVYERLQRLADAHKGYLASGGIRKSPRSDVFLCLICAIWHKPFRCSKCHEEKARYQQAEDLTEWEKVCVSNSCPDCHDELQHNMMNPCRSGMGGASAGPLDQDCGSYRTIAVRALEDHELAENPEEPIIWKQNITE